MTNENMVRLTVDGRSAIVEQTVIDLGGMMAPAPPGKKRGQIIPANYGELTDVMIPSSSIETLLTSPGILRVIVPTSS